MRRRESLFVTRPTMPPLPDLLPMLEEIWRTRLLSNNGPFLQKFEAALMRYFDVEHVSVVSNAALGLILALRQLAVSGEVITTPFSFVASSHVIRWAGAEPVFADIDPVTLNLDPAEVERRITPRTTAILGVHCYGVPCDVSGLEAVAARHNLKIVYDAAHAFGVRTAGKSLLLSGDLSVLSFHATKVFNTLEGGAIVAPDRDTKVALDVLGNHGIVDETTIPVPGINAKMNELNAAFGLALLPHVEQAIQSRRAVAERYWEQLENVRGIRCVCPPGVPGHNYYAFPILVGDAYPISRDALYARLRERGIYSRRYFYPLIADLPMYRDQPSAREGELAVARDAAARILCLPMFPDLSPEDQQEVIDLIRRPPA
jgi:dTDP-4-amino-4,6-dideoxygalactose transaminase